MPRPRFELHVAWQIAFHSAIGVVHAAASAAPVASYRTALPGPDLDRNAPARRHANLAPWQCREQLRRLKLPAKPVGGPSLGIATPLRLAGEFHGVSFAAPGKKSPYGKLDCRLVLALNELARLLSERGVVRVRIDNLYRPRAHLPGKRHKKSQHAYGLAIDLTEFELEDGRVLEVERDWHGRIGGVSCGPDSVLSQPNAASVTLRNLFCDIVASGIFHHHLTPNYDAAHRDHLHLDIQRGETRRWIR